MILDPATLERRVLNGLMNGLVAPRPIAWVSTVGPDGTPNLAPFSFFNAFSFHPYPTVGIGPGARAGIDKDSLANCRATPRADDLDGLRGARAQRERHERGVRARGRRVDGRGRDPGAVAARRPAAGRRGARRRSSAASIEIVDLGSDEVPSNALVIARVVSIYVRDDAIDADLRPLADVLRLVGRGGGNDWIRTTDRFELLRPSSVDPDEVALAARGSG